MGNASHPRSIAPKRQTLQAPWGAEDILTINEPSTVKVLTVLPGEELSLQAHDHRSEWWIVLDTKMRVVVNDKTFTVYRGDEVFIPQGAKHRAIGLDKPCRWIEISFGPFDEADIHRFADKYGRH